LHDYLSLGFTVYAPTISPTPAPSIGTKWEQLQSYSAKVVKIPLYLLVQERNSVKVSDIVSY